MRFVQYIARLFTRRDSVVNAALDWSKALSNLGHDVVLAHGTTDVWGTNFGPAMEETYVLHAGAGKNLVPLQLGRVLRPGDVLILHADWRPANLVAAAVARRKGIPYVVVPHGEYNPQQVHLVDHFGPVRQAAERQLLRRSLAVHVFWPSEVANVRAFAGDVRCVVAPTGVDLTDDRWRGGGEYLSWIGRYFVDCKGLDLLAGALARLDPDRRPTVRLHGIDQRGELAGLVELVGVLGVNEAMLLGGPILGEDKQRFLAQADAYVHPSRWEAHSVALLENLALGVPCLVSRGNQCADELAGAGAALIADADEVSLAQGLERLMAADRVALGQAARAFARDRLSWETSANAFVDGVRAALA